VPDADLDFLATDEQLTAVYDVTLADHHTGSADSAQATQQVTIVLSGSNDAPTWGGDSTLAGSIEERPNSTGSAAVNSAAGSIAFTDPDLTDRPTASVDAAGQTVRWQDAAHDYSSELGSDQIARFLQSLQVSSPAGNTNRGGVDWAYGIADKHLDFLAAGERIEVTTPIVVDDHHGATDSAEVVITLYGVNDAPAAAPDSNGTTKNSNLAVAAANGVLANDTDPDVHDRGHLVVSQINGSAANVGRAVAGTYGSLTLGADGSYVYAAKRGALPAQLVAQDTFSYSVDDGQGGTATSSLSIVVVNPGDSYQAGANMTLRGGNGKDVLDGSAGGDVLIGGNGADVLIGGDRNTLTGGNGPDTFLFRPGFGANIVTDFDVKIDAIQFDRSLFTSVADIIDHTMDTAAGAVITDTYGNSVTLVGVGLPQLQAHLNDFYLV
jgi:VCBS repeat-containing protein